MSKEPASSGSADLSSLDRLIHAPARLSIMTILAAVENADFLYLRRETGLTEGNLSTHLSKLEEAEYIQVEKSFQGKRPHTDYRLTEKGSQAFGAYVKQIRGALGA